MELVIYSPTEDGFLKSIDFNYDELKTQLEQQLKKYEGLVYSDENIKQARADKATLNNFKKAIEARRIEIKKQCLLPYDTFEVKVKDLIAMVDKPVNAITTQVTNYEQLIKDEKLAGIKIVYADRVGDLAKLVPFDKIFNERWLNVTYKGSDIEKEIKELFVKIEADLKVIDELQTDYSLQIKDTYLKNYDLTAALQEKTRLEEQAAKIAEHKRLQAEKAQREKELKAQEQPKPTETVKAPTPVPEPIAQEIPKPEPQKVEQLRQMDFRVWGTVEQLLDLQQYLKTNGIKYGKVVA
jgi:hypothetical protein